MSMNRFLIVFSLIYIPFLLTAYKINVYGIVDDTNSNEHEYETRSIKFLRFGRTEQPPKRLDRNQAKFLRFGRSSQSFFQQTRSQSPFLRFGRYAFV